MRRSLLLISVVLTLGGCGSAGRPEAPARTPSSSAEASEPGAASSGEPTVSTRGPAPATSAGASPLTRTGASTPATKTAATSTVPTTTAPVNLPPSRKRKGPRSISVAEASHPIVPSKGRSAAQQLVEAWKGRAVSPADPNAVLVQRHLSSLAHKCTESEAAIAGYIRSGIQRYRRYGVIESPVEFSRALDSAVPPGRSSCRGILRTLLAQVEQG